jgi:hypothetical protein
MEYKIKIRDSTTPELLDSFFENAWTFRKPVKFVIDVTECISLGRILSMKGVLDKHRKFSEIYRSFRSYNEVSLGKDHFEYRTFDHQNGETRVYKTCQIIGMRYKMFKVRWGLHNTG